jgi:hypothetical protein
MSPGRRARLGAAAVCGTAGAVSLGVAAVGASGTRVVSDQLSYLATGGVVGATLVGVACALLVLDVLAELQRRLAAGPPAPGRMMEPGQGDEIDLAPPGLAVAVSNELVHVRGSRRVHRADCRLVSGKRAAEPTTGTAVTELQLSACGVCQPSLEPVPC